MDITLDGPRTIVTVNGVKVTDYTEGDPVPPSNSTLEPSAACAPISATSASRTTPTTTSSFSRKSLSTLQKSGQ